MKYLCVAAQVGQNPRSSDPTSLRFRQYLSDSDPALCIEIWLCPSHITLINHQSLAMRILFNFTSREHQCTEDWNGQSSGQHLMPTKDLMKREPKGCSRTCVSMVWGCNDGWCVWVNHFSWTRLYWSTFPQCFYSKHPFWEADTVIYHTVARRRECFVFLRISAGSLFCRPGFYTTHQFRENIVCFSPFSPPQTRIRTYQCDKVQQH